MRQLAATIISISILHLWKAMSHRLFLIEKGRSDQIAIIIELIRWRNATRSKVDGPWTAET